MRFLLSMISTFALNLCHLQAVAQAPTAEEIRQAVSNLPAGRIGRPGYDFLTAEQRRYVEGILSGPRDAISGPLVVMLLSPLLGDLAERLMAHARFSGTEGFSSVPPKLNELAVIMAAKAWSSPYVWNAHNRYAVTVGLPPALVRSSEGGARQRPPD